MINKLLKAVSKKLHQLCEWVVLFYLATPAAGSPIEQESRAGLALPLLRSQFVTSNRERTGLRYSPLAFTERGVAMLSSVLNSESHPGKYSYHASFCEASGIDVITQRTRIQTCGA